MRSKDVILKELDLIVHKGFKLTEDQEVLFWDGKRLIDELYRGYKDNLLMRFVEVALKWPKGLNSIYGVKNGKV